MNATDTARECRRSRRTSLLIGTAVAVASIGAGTAWAQTPEPVAEPAEAVESLAQDPAAAEGAQPEPATDPASEDATTEAPAADDEDAEKARRRGKQLRLTKEEASPRKVFYDGRRKAKFEYEFAGQRTVDLVIDIVKRKAGADERVRRYREQNRDGSKTYELRWDGKRENGDLVKEGKFYFRVAEVGGRRLKREGANGDRDFRLFSAIFPIDGNHQYWDGFGAGRGHQGQDVGAKCGTPLVAAEPGTVTTKAYNGGGYGYYLVIDVRNSNRSEVYGHMKDKAIVRQGEHIETGQRIGKVGATGNASGCHLHFEYRPNGAPSAAVTNKLKAWDKYS